MKKLEGSSLLSGKWPVCSTLIILVLAVSYFFTDVNRDFGYGIDLHLIYGIAGLSLILWLSLYWIRKRIYRLRLGSMQGWLKAHLYLSIISLFLVYFHSGFSISTNLSGILVALFFLAFVSGIIGLIIYDIVPVLLAKRSRDILSKDEISTKINDFLHHSDRLAGKTSERFRDVYKREIRPLFTSRKTKWSYFLNEEQSLVMKWEATFERIKTRIPRNEVFDMNLLSSIYVEKERLVFQLAKLRLMNDWLIFHVPATAALLTTVIFHIFSIVYY